MEDKLCGDGGVFASYCSHMGKVYNMISTNDI